MKLGACVMPHPAFRRRKKRKELHRPRLMKKLELQPKLKQKKMLKLKLPQMQKELLNLKP